LRYHADMEFIVLGELAGAYRGKIGTIVAIDFSNWTITLRMKDGADIVTGRQAVALYNHHHCDAPCGCTADAERTEREP
jgi:hypothetical protein